MSPTKKGVVSCLKAASTAVTQREEGVLWGLGVCWQEGQEESRDMRSGGASVTGEAEIPVGRDKGEKCGQTQMQSLENSSPKRQMWETKKTEDLMGFQVSLTFPLHVSSHKEKLRGKKTSLVRPQTSSDGTGGNQGQNGMAVFSSTGALSLSQAHMLLCGSLWIAYHF